MEDLFHPWLLPPIIFLEHSLSFEKTEANKIFAKIVIFLKFLKSGKKLNSPSNYFLERDVLPWTMKNC